MLEQLQEILNLPQIYLMQCTFIPAFLRNSIIQSLYFVPILFFLYFAIELFERFCLKHIKGFIKLLKLGLFASIPLSIIPECGLQVLFASLFSRRVISRGTLLAAFIVGCDDAIPFLFMDFSKIKYILPLIVLKVVIAFVVAIVMDIPLLWQKNTLNSANSMNTDIFEVGCCHHKLSSKKEVHDWWIHPFTHTLYMFGFCFIALLICHSIIDGLGSISKASAFLGINTPYQVLAGSIFGLVPNCISSVFLAVFYVKGLISFPTLLAGLTTTTGFGMLTLTKVDKSDKNNLLIMFMLTFASLLIGMFAYYHMDVVNYIANFIK